MLFFSLIITFLHSMEFNIYTQKNKRIMEILKEAAIKTGTEGKFDEVFSQSNITRLDVAVYAMDVIKKLEDKNITVAGIDEVINEFDSEFLILNVQEELTRQKENLRLLEELTSRINFLTEFGLFLEKPAGEFPVSQREKILYGNPPESVLSIAHQLRFKIRGRENNTSFLLSLRNFGYWGVGSFTSGSIGIGFSSKDPLQIEEGYIRYKLDSFETKFGRKYLRYGVYGMLYEGSYEAKDSIFVSLRLPFLKTGFDVISQFDAADTYILFLRTGKKSFIESSYLFTLYRENTKMLLNIENQEKLDVSGRLYLPGGFLLEGEWLKSIENSFAVTAGYETEKIRSLLRYVELTQAPEPFPVNRAQIEFLDFSYLRNEENTKALNFTTGFRYGKVSFNYEFLYSTIMDSDEINRYSRFFIEGEFSKGFSYIFDSIFNYSNYSIFRAMLKIVL